jgi:surfeit locus 1 family protein
VAQGVSRNERPSVPVPGGEVTISGWLDHPRSLPVIVAGEIPAEASFWPYLDLDALVLRLGAPLPRYVIRAEPPSGSGLRQKAPSFDAKVGMHIGYAIQWFAFAAVAAGVYMAASLKRSA